MNPTINNNDYILIKKLKNKAQISNQVQKREKEWFKFVLFKKPINLLFSIDQFLFEYSKKQPQRRKSSEFLQQLKQRKKLSFFYGDLSKKQIRSLLNQASNYPGCRSKNFLFLLERRLDVVLYRSRLVDTISSARQLITHNKITVNGNTVSIPSYSVKNGDIISSSTNKGLFLPLKKIADFKKSIGFKPRNVFKQEKGIKNKPYSRYTVSPNFFLKLSQSPRNKWFDKQKQLKKTEHSFGDFSKTLFLKPKSIFQNKTQGLNPLFTNKFLYQIKYLLKKIETRVYLIPKKNIALLKYKPLLEQKARFLYFSLQPQLTNRNVFKFRAKSFKKKEFESKKNFNEKNRNLAYTKSATLLSKSNILHIITGMSEGLKKPFKNLLILKLKKHFSKKHSLNLVLNRLRKNSVFGNKNTINLVEKKNFWKSTSKLFGTKPSFLVGGIKPTHLEISYKLKKIIFLYSPQRLSYPFYIDIDQIVRSFH